MKINKAREYDFIYNRLKQYILKEIIQGKDCNKQALSIIAFSIRGRLRTNMSYLSPDNCLFNGF